MEYIIYRSDTELYHHGVKGMKWGVRRVKDSHIFKENRKKYRSDLENRLKSENYTDRKKIVKSATKDAALSFFKSNIKNNLAGMAVGAGLGILGGLVPATLPITTMATYGVSAIQTGQWAVNMVNTGSKLSTIRDLDRQYNR